MADRGGPPRGRGRGGGGGGGDRGGPRGPGSAPPSSSAGSPSQGSFPALGAPGSARGRGEEGPRGRGDGPPRGRGGGGRGGGRGRGGSEGGGSPEETSPQGPSGVEAREERTVIMRASGPQQMTGREFALRPGYGTVGKPVQLFANYFPVRNTPDKTVFHYDITPKDKGGKEIELQRKNREILEQFYVQHRDLFPTGVYYAYDGRKNLYSTGPLKLETGDKKTTRSVSVDKGDATGEYTVVIQPTDPATVPLNLIAIYLAPSGDPTSREVPLLPLTVLDLFLRQGPLSKSSTHLLGRSLFTSANAISIGGGLEVWSGVFQSARLTEGSGIYPETGARQGRRGMVMVNVDLSFTSVFKSQEVLAFMAEVGRNFNPQVKLTEQERRNIETRIRNAKVELTHRKVGADGNSFAKKVIRGISNKNANETTFERDGKKISVAQYFQTTYNLKLRFPNLNLLKSGGANGDTFFPAEVCRIIEGTRYTGPMSDNDRSGMIKASTQRPGDKKVAIERAFASLELHNNPHLKALGVQVDNQMVKVAGRVLPAPALSYGRNKVLEPRTGAWNLARTAYLSPAAMPSYGYVLMCSDYDMSEDGLWELDTRIRQTFGETGMQIAHADDVAYVRMGQQVNIASFQQAVTNVIARCAQVFPGTTRPGLLFFIVNVRHNYELIKSVMDREVGIPSQVMQARNLKKQGNSLTQYLANVSLKVNTKLGGVNQMLKEPPAPFVTDDIIVMGADVSHYTGDDKPSIAALVATINPQLTKYFPSVRLQSNKTEVIEKMQDIIKDSLLAYYRTNGGKKPKRVLFYRDGVSEGQFQIVYDNEIKAMKRAFAALEKDYNPHVTFTVMTKRHKTKIFVANPNPDTTDRSGNALPGTVVDTTITHPYEYDFFLMSHAGIQGTSRPAHYYVLLDENNLSSDIMQQFTYRLCYVYSRATRSVSLIPPTYYAHLLAYRVRIYVNQGHQNVAAHTGLVPSVNQNTTARDFARTMFYV
ncbi:Piwi-domain-containing protein [Gonapodya prolifera JEL478]|uniref:Piwi-domain-containing protein n=1 Tax=Gonapodya prolifera (strain JEL478) TaxID=1344416 RepID=A0A139AUH8_GONPJ|nr:Piwi-domain-containing protein [Gonapodya prolifera JEL478]|eukprot:KXS20382.1 Piwi-domain-containing protein [Gonapodya prolifera JEL478]